MASVLMVIAPQNFRDEEFLLPFAELQAQGHKVVVASVEAGECVGSLGACVTADTALSQGTMDYFDALVFVGGNGSVAYKDDIEARRLVDECLKAKKLLAAICAAPSVLASFGVLNGIKATAFPSFEDELSKAGAAWTGMPVQVDMHPSGSIIITANGPDAAEAFGLTIANNLR